MDNRNLFNLVYLICEQPVTCLTCGARTDIIFDLAHSILGTQIHECSNENCKRIFVTEDDELGVAESDKEILAELE